MPSSTLFPYTTLFRSFPDDCPHRYQQENRIEQRGQDRATAEAVSSSLGPDTFGHCTRPPRQRQSEDVAQIVPGIGEKDRKSTRLNSSHLGISYAVFCL